MGYSTQKPYAVLMRGRPDEPDSHESLAVYTHAEYQQYRRQGWKPAVAFLEMVDRWRRREP